MTGSARPADGPDLGATVTEMIDALAPLIGTRWPGNRDVLIARATLAVRAEGATDGDTILTLTVKAITDQIWEDGSDGPCTHGHLDRLTLDEEGRCPAHQPMRRVQP